MTTNTNLHPSPSAPLSSTWADRQSADLSPKLIAAGLTALKRGDRRCWCELLRAIDEAEAGGRASKADKLTSAGPTPARTSRIHNSDHEPPTSNCERCGVGFLRLHFHPRMSPKRFCSERCRKAAENARAKQRKQHG